MYVIKYDIDSPNNNNSLIDNSKTSTLVIDITNLTIVRKITRLVNTNIKRNILSIDIILLYCAAKFQI